MPNNKLDPTQIEALKKRLTFELSDYDYKYHLIVLTDLLITALTTTHKANCTAGLACIVKMRDTCVEHILNATDFFLTTQLLKELKLKGNKHERKP